MRHATRKTLSWFLFLTSLNASVAFLIVCIYEGLPVARNAIWYFWPLCSLPVAAFSAFYLRWLSRQESNVERGRWQITLHDLLLVSLLAGLFFACWHTCAPRTFVFRGIAVGLVASLALLAGLLAASRTGFNTFPWKHVYAVGVVLRLWGYVGLTLFLGLTVICTIAGRTEQLLFHTFPPSWRTDAFPILFVPIRWGLPALLPGMFLCWLARRHLPPAGSTARAAAGTIPPAQNAPRPADESAPVFQFSLKSLLIVVLTIAVWMYLVFTWYGLGFCAGLLAMSLVLLTITFYRRPRYIGGLALMGILWSLLTPLIVAFTDVVLGGRFGLCPGIVAGLTGYLGLEVFLFAWVNPYRTPFRNSRWSILLAAQYPVVFFLYVFGAGAAFSSLRRLFH